MQYCGSIANPISTKDEKENSKEPGNKMHVRVFVTAPNINKTEFKATYIAYRTLNPNNMGGKFIQLNFKYVEIKQLKAFL